MAQNNATLNHTHLGPEGKDPEGTHGSKEQEGCGNLDEVGGHHTEGMHPGGQVVGVPRQWGRDALHTGVGGREN